jgi:hypothetical protein
MLLFLLLRRGIKKTASLLEIVGRSSMPRFLLDQITHACKMMIHPTSIGHNSTDQFQNQSIHRGLLGRILCNTSLNDELEVLWLVLRILGLFCTCA